MPHTLTVIENSDFSMFQWGYKVQKKLQAIIFKI